MPLTRVNILKRLSKSTIIVTGGRSKNVRAVLDDGLILDGTPEQIKRHLERMGGDTTWYVSNKGLIRIRDMESTHLRNAIQKGYEEWVNELRKIGNPLTYVQAMALGIQNPTWIAMVEELMMRSR